jgi:toxin ParE1/3/4
VNAAGNEPLPPFFGREHRPRGNRAAIHDLNPVAAHHLLDALEDACQLLAQHPLLGRLRPELAENLRSFAVGNHLIFYTPTPDGIDVVRIIYGGRNLPKIFGR